MKRRNADCGKIRRPIKRNKIAEGMYGSTTILYMKFLILWAIVITADFMFMFRFEFLWPFWLLLRSVHDSFKYKGLAFSVLFVCIAITSDLVCLFFIPVHWLLFAASTYVWVQYVWHTDKGICLPTIILWMLFVYLEAGIRWKDSRHMPHLDLCRPFAAHCIGYPVVTLGFGFKSYVGYRMRQRKQREVAKENEFYMQLLQQALPQDEALDDLQNLSANGSVVVSATATMSSSGAAQTIHSNSIASDHHSNSHHGDDKNHIGHMNSSQTTAIQHQSSLPNNHHHQHHHHNNFNNSSSSSSNRNAQINSKMNHISNSVTTTTTATANGHVGNSLNNSLTSSSSSRNQRRSVDKDRNDSNQQQANSASNNNNTSFSSGKSANNNHVSSSSSGDGAASHSNSNSSSKSSSASNASYLNQLSNNTQKESKDKDNWDSCSSSTTSSASSNSSVNSSKDGRAYQTNSYEMTNGNHPSLSTSDKKNQPNGNIAHYEVEEVVAEPIEKVKGRRNRSKRDTQGSSKDNHANHNNGNSYTSQQANNNSNQQQHKDSTTSLDSSTSSSSSLSSSASAAAATISNVASQIVSKVCETCLRLEAEIKKYRNEISHMKQIENELRQKMESNAINKSCLQAKQRENDEMEKRIQELNSCRQADMANLQNVERRLNDERRQRQSLESLLNNEKKARKLAEEKANRAECSEQCKQRKMQLEQEIKQLRRELKANEDAKQVAEQQGRKFEQELRMFEAEVRNREAQQGTEVLMSALAAMQDKNSTLEKNLSAETRVKLDLFSALGEAKRQLEIKDSMIRSKDEEVLDLKAKIAQLLAVMPTDSLCLPQCSTTGSSMLRMNDTPPLQGPSSPIMSLAGPTHQQLMAAAAAAAAAHQQQMNSRGGGGMVSNVVTVVTSTSGVTNAVTSSGNVNANNVITQTSSNLDPNATAYTPKNSSLVGGAEA